MIGISDDDFEKLLEVIPKSRTREVVEIIARTRQFSDSEIRELEYGLKHRISRLRGKLEYHTCDAKEILKARAGLADICEESLEKLKLCRGP